MHKIVLRSLALSSALAGLLPSLVCAQASPPAAPSAPQPAEAGRGNQTIERIRVEDAGSRIDELRVGGQTQSIVVQPKNDMPAYEVRPADPRTGAAQGGSRVWNFLRF